MTPWTQIDHEGSRCLALNISVDTADKEGSLTLKIMPKRCENAHNFMCVENNKEATGKTIDMEMAVEGNKQKGRFSTGMSIPVRVCYYKHLLYKIKEFGIPGMGNVCTVKSTYKYQYNYMFACFV